MKINQTNLDRDYDPQSTKEKMEFVNNLPPKFRVEWINDLMNNNNLGSIEADDVDRIMNFLEKWI